MSASQATCSFRLRVLLQSILQPLYCLVWNPCVGCASHMLLPTSCFTEIHLTAPLPCSESMRWLRKPHAPSDFVFYGNLSYSPSFASLGTHVFAVQATCSFRLPFYSPSMATLGSHVFAAQATFSFRLRVLRKSILQLLDFLTRNPCVCCASHMLLPTSILQPLYCLARKPCVCCASHILLPTSCFTV